MKILLAIISLLAALAALPGCNSKPPRMREYEIREFEFPANLVDLAVLDSGAAPGAVKEEHEKAGVVDFVSPNGRIIRVESTVRGVSCRVLVSHAGQGGQEGAIEALDTIAQWIKESDDFRDIAPPKGSRRRLP